MELNKLYINFFKQAIIFVLIFESSLILSQWITNITERKNEKSYVVKVTMYTTDPKQTDDSPFITASGFKLDSTNPKKDKIIAISRDLKDSLKFGTKVRLENIGEYSGEYVVHDVMNRRFKKRIDILINPDERAISFDSVKMFIINLED